MEWNKPSFSAIVGLDIYFGNKDKTDDSFKINAINITYHLWTINNWVNYITIYESLVYTYKQTINYQETKDLGERPMIL